MAFTCEEVVYSASSIDVESDPSFGSRYTNLFKAFIRVEKVSMGLESTVEAGSSKEHEQEVVIKNWRTIGMSAGDQRLFKKTLNTELRKWRQTSSHPNIVGFLGLAPNERVLHGYEASFNHEGIPGLILPFHRNGNAIEYLIRHPTVDTLPILIGVSDAIRHLHSRQPPIIHGKIQGCNIMISDDGRPMLTDIGMANLPYPPGLGGAQSSNEARWMPPELLDVPPKSNGGDEPFPSSTGSDVYSFAMTILELMTRSRPYANRRPVMRVILDVVSGRWPSRPTECDEMTYAIWEMLTKCWNREAEQRPGIAVVSGVLAVEYFMKGAMRSGSLEFL